MEKKIIGIYKITSKTKKKYVGKSVDIYGRWKEYRQMDCKAQPRLYNSLKKYGWQKHTFEIITECNVEELKKLERYYQELYQCIGKNGLNCVVAADDDNNGYASEETKKKMSFAMSGVKKSDEHKKKIGITKIGNKNVLGLKWTDDQRKELCIIRGNEVEKNKFFGDLNIIRRKKVNKIDIKTGVTIESFESMCKASSITKIDRKSISISCQNSSKSAGGFKWEYA